MDDDGVTDKTPLVMIGRYTYRWDGDEALKVGDRVLLPATWLSELKLGPGPFEGTVTGIGSEYVGRLSRIIRKV